MATLSSSIAWDSTTRLGSTAPGIHIPISSTSLSDCTAPPRTGCRSMSPSRIRSPIRSPSPRACSFAAMRIGASWNRFAKTTPIFCLLNTELGGEPVLWHAQAKRVGRFTWPVNAFSDKLENLQALYLRFALYNFCPVHWSLGVAQRRLEELLISRGKLRICSNDSAIWYNLKCWEASKCLTGFAMPPMYCLLRQ